MYNRTKKEQIKLAVESNPKVEKSLEVIETFCKSQEFEEITTRYFEELDSEISEMQDILEGLVDTTVWTLDKKSFENTIKQNIILSILTTKNLGRLNSKVLYVVTNIICKDTARDEAEKYLKENISPELFERFAALANLVSD